MWVTTPRGSPPDRMWWPNSQELFKIYLYSLNLGYSESVALNLSSFGKRSCSGQTPIKAHTLGFSPINLNNINSSNHGVSWSQKCWEPLIYNTVISIYVCRPTICFNITTLCILLSNFIYVFQIILRINRNYFPAQYQLTGFCNGDEVCSLWGGK
jgi:hypothetical protein